MITTCKNDFRGTRDKAIMLCLLDTVAGAKELVSMNLDDIDLTNGTRVFRKGKRKEPQDVLIGNKTGQALHDYLRFRPDKSPPALWITSSGKRLPPSAVQQMLYGRGKLAGVHPPSINDFKRASRKNK